MLYGYLDIVCLLDALPYAAGTVQNAAERMRTWLDAMIDSKQRIVLFNDTAYNGAPSIPGLPAYADRVLATNNSTSYGEALPIGCELQVHHLEEIGYIHCTGQK